MKNSNYSEEQIAFALKQAELETPISGMYYVPTLMDSTPKNGQ